MVGLVKSPLQTVVVEGIYNDILTKNAQYYYFLGRTNPWGIEDGASPGEDGTWVPGSVPPLLQPPAPQDTFRYELGVRNSVITYKLVKPSDVSFIIPRHNWTSGVVYDMYDDSYSTSYMAYSGASTLATAKFYVLTSLNNVYKCISNNYNMPSIYEPTGSSPDEYVAIDGYIWKFMYNIPVALQNKFYTFDYIPVMTSLRNRFYENGAISSVAVQNPGSGYTNSTSLVISGDGFLENNPYAIGSTCVVADGGSGYTPTATITNATWLTGNTTYTTVGSGTGVVGTPTMSSMSVNVVTVVNGGSGFPATTTQVVTFSGGGATVQAVGLATINALGTVTSIAVTTSGSGYTSAPTLVIAGGGFGGVYTVNMTNFTVDTITVIAGGSGFPVSSNQTLTFTGGGATTQATGYATIDISGVVNGFFVSTPGVGYTSAPSISVAGGGVQPTYTVHILNGIVSTITVVTGGTTYPLPIQVVTFSGGGATTQATGYATINSSGAVSSITVSTAGVNYSSVPTLSVAGGGVGVVTTVSMLGGTVTTIAISNVGLYFPPNTTQTITFSGGGASTQATGTITINNTGEVNVVTILTPGVGYTSVPTFTITSQAYSANDKIQIRNAVPGAYNGDYIITSVTPFTITVANAVNPATYTSGGIISKSILTFSTPLWGIYKTPISAYTIVNATGIITNIVCDPQLVNGVSVYGYGYDQSATVIVDQPITGSTDWVANTAYGLNQIVKANNNYYKVTIAGTVNTILPSHITPIGVIYGSCTLLFIATRAAAQVILSKTEAIMLPIIMGGQITGVQIIDGGVGYTYCNIIAQDSPQNTTSILVADIAVGNINTVQADVELTAQQNIGALSYIKIAQDPLTLDYISHGGYGVDTVVTISGDGTGATAVPVISNGSIVAIRLTNKGVGYTRDANVTIYPLHLDSNGVYVGTKARAILSPTGGHGSNAIHEFNSSKILFYSVLSDERVHGLQNLNDYRQFGVVKNPKLFGSGTRMSATTGTPTWLVTSPTAISNFESDDVINQGGTDTYRVVLVQDTQMVLQAITQSMPSMISFTNTNTSRLGATCVVALITAPQVDKFSGDILFIDNKLPFVVTSDQMIAFRTTIGFA